MSAVDIAVADMALANDRPIGGVNQNFTWAHRANIGMGARAHGDAAPRDFYNMLSRQSSKDWEFMWWHRLQLWFVTYRALNGNPYANDAVQIRNMVAQIKRRSTSTWHVVGSSNPSDANQYNYNINDVPDRKPTIREALSGGGYEFIGAKESRYPNIHGYGASIDLSGFPVQDIACITVTCEARTTKANPGGPNDHLSALQMISVGCDYYQNMVVSVRNGDFDPERWGPGVGGNRFRLLTEDFQLFSFSTILPANNVPINGKNLLQDTVGATVAQRTITEAEFRANPPSFSLSPPGGSASLGLQAPASADVGSVIRVRVVDESGAPVSGATVSWQGDVGGQIFGSTNSIGVVPVLLTSVGGYTLRATNGGPVATAQINILANAVSNQLEYSEDLTAGEWDHEGAGSSVTADTTGDIYGTTTMDTFTSGSPVGPDPSSVFQKTTTISVAGRVSGTIFAKALPSEPDWIVLNLYHGLPDIAIARIWFNVRTGNLGAAQALGQATNILAEVIPWGNGIFECRGSFDSPHTGGEAMLQVRIDSGNQAFTYPVGAKVALWGAQMLQGAAYHYQPANRGTPVEITPKALPLAQTGQPYVTTITCIGVPPIAWSISSGSLPAGITADTGQTSTTLTLSSDNVTASSGATFTVTAIDANGSDSESFAIPVEVTDDDPADLTAAPVNSDTLHLEWTNRAGGATETVIEAQYLDSVEWTDWGTVATINPLLDEFDLPDLLPGRQYRVRIYQRTPGGRTGNSNVATATTWRLWAYAHIEPVPGGLTGIVVAAGDLPEPGEVFPGRRYRAADGEQIDPETVIWGGKEHSRITLPLVEQPPGAKLRAGDPCTMVAYKTLSPTSRVGTHLMFNGIIVEGP